ncbi:MAG: ComEC/Rec2 family competence protein [Ilumatobacter sp.]
MSAYSVLAALDGNVDGETDTTPGRYATGSDDAGHIARAFTLTRMLAAALVVSMSVWLDDAALVALLVIVVSAACRSWLLALMLIVLAVAGMVRSEEAWLSVVPDDLGTYRGWVLVVDDPQPFASSTRVIVQVDGERFEVWSRGRAQQLRVRTWHGGEWVAASGRRVELDPQRAGRVAWQHVVGEFELEWASDVHAGGPVARASNRVRAAIERAGDELPHHDGALFRGLVVGDDRDQPREMIDRFRASGLSHLTAVSGQNVSFLLAAAGPLLRRLRPRLRWAVTLGLIIWFVTLTRFEPSIVRAGVMAGLSTTAFVLGRDRSPIRILAVAVILLVLVDPLLVWSVGFWLSVGATFGVSAIGPWLAARFAGFDRTGLFALPLGVTLGAQVGVVVPSVLVFGRLPLVSIPANLLAVPVAGLVMLYGMPAGLIAGWMPSTAPVLMFPARLGTRWVDTVASIGARLEPEPPAQFVGWGVVVLIVVLLLWFSRNTADTHGDLPADR